MWTSATAAPKNPRRLLAIVAALATVAVLTGLGTSRLHRTSLSSSAHGPTGPVYNGQESNFIELVNYEPLEGVHCPWMPGANTAGTSELTWELASARFESPLEAAQSSLPASAKSTAQPAGGDIRPIRTIEDPYSVFAAIAVDPVHDEVVMSDENLFSLLVYGRTTNSKGVAEPRRKIGGLHSRMEFICGVAVDPDTRDIYTVNNDTLDNMVVFSPDARGDAPPTRELQVDHGAWGVSLDREHNEIAVTIEHYNKIAFDSKTAQADAGPVRFIQGAQTGMADPHGVYVDAKNDEVVVTDHGAWHLVQSGQSGSVSRGGGGDQAAFSRRESSGGRFQAPSIRVFSRTASGDVAPLRVIEGPHTQLRMPQGVAVDSESDQILVANDGGNSILFFPRTAQGDMAPVRTIEGPATGVKNPNGVAVDAAHNEVWVTNWGDHSATVYPRTAQGNVAPLRTIRTAPPHTPQSGLGNPGAVAYDPVRQEIAVPN